MGVVHLAYFNELSMGMRTKSIVLTLATALTRFPATTFDVVFIGAAMAFDAVVELADTFFNVFASNVVGSVFVATVTGRTTVVVACVAGDATGVVVLI